MEVDIAAPGGNIINQNGEIDLGQLLLLSYPLYLDNPFEEIGIEKGYILNRGQVFLLL